MRVPMESELVALVGLIRSWIAAGLKPEEIAARIADPLGTGHELLERAAARQKAGAEYLQRDVMVEAEEPATVPKPKRSRRKKRKPKPELIDPFGSGE